MTHRDGHTTWEWRECAWQAPASVEAVTDLLDYVAASPGLGPVVLEFHVTKDARRWLIAADPIHIDDLATALTTHLPVSIQTPRHTRTEPVFEAWLRLSGYLVTSNPDRVEATTRSLYGNLARLEDGEEVTVQLLLGARHAPPVKPRTDFHAWLSLLAGQPTREVSKDAAARRRGMQHGFSATLRIGITGTNGQRAKHLISLVVNALRGMESTSTRISWEPERWPRIHRVARPWRWPLTLTSGELVGFTGWPIGKPPLPLFGNIHPRQIAPTTPLTGTERIFGELAAPGRSEPVGIPIRDAAFHTHLLGPTGSGKSTAMLNLITADINAKRGVLVLDPKGDLATDVLARIPKHREQDVVVLDPVSATPIGFNPLAGPARQAEITADTLLATFEALFSQNWGIRSADIFTAAFLTLARIPGANLLWLPPLLTNLAFRRRILAQVNDPLGVGAFWAQYEQKRPERQAEEIGPVLNKLRQLILRPSLRAILGQADPQFDLSQLFRERRIIIVNLNRGLIGADAARLLGSLLIGQLWSRILARQADPLTHRHIVSIYIDEVHDFLTGIPGDLSDALAQARSLGAAFTVANQYLAQLTPAMRQALETNTRNKIFFGLSGTDAAGATKLAPELDAQDFLLLPRYHAYATLLHAGTSTGWISVTTKPAPVAISNPATVYATSQTRYGVAATETEQHILNLITTNTPTSDQDDAGPIGRSHR